MQVCGKREDVLRGNEADTVEVEDGDDEAQAHCAAWDWIPASGSRGYNISTLIKQQLTFP